MRTICSKRPDMLSGALLKEYLVGVPYQEVRGMNMEPHFLALLPVTPLLPLLDYCQIKVCLKSCPHIFIYWKKLYFFFFFLEETKEQILHGMPQI